MSRDKPKLGVVGQRTYFEVCSPPNDTPNFTTEFFDFRSGDDPGRLVEELKSAKCDFLFFFKPEVIPPGFLNDVPGIKVGWMTEPVPRAEKAPDRIYDDASSAPDAETIKVLKSAAENDLNRRLEASKNLDAESFDRLIVFDPRIASTVERFATVWKSTPLPVNDSYFSNVTPMTVPPRVTFLGRPTLHRDLMLGPSLHSFDIRYIAHGFFGESLRNVLEDSDIGISLHNERYPNFENRVSVHLAMGHLVITEPLDPLHGLEPGLDFIEVKTARELYSALEEVFSFPQSQQIVRERGRAKAEYFRASRVFSELIAELSNA